MTKIIGRTLSSLDQTDWEWVLNGKGLWYWRPPQDAGGGTEPGSHLQRHWGGNICAAPQGGVGTCIGQGANNVGQSQGVTGVCPQPYPWVSVPANPVHMGEFGKWFHFLLRG